MSLFKGVSCNASGEFNIISLTPTPSLVKLTHYHLLLNRIVKDRRPISRIAGMCAAI